MAAAATGAGETSTTDLPGKQNSLKHLNLTREKIKNGTKRENKRERRGRETSRTPDCLLCCSEGAWLLLRLLKQRETLRIYHTAWGLFRFPNPGMQWLCQVWAYKYIFTLKFCSCIHFFCHAPHFSTNKVLGNPVPNLKPFNLFSIKKQQFWGRTYFFAKYKNGYM